MTPKASRQFVTRDDVPLPPYEWSHVRRGARSTWGVSLAISERHDLQLMAQRGTAGRWSWTVTVYRAGGNVHVTRVAGGVEPTLSAARPAAEAAVGLWVSDQLDLPEDTLCKGLSSLSPGDR